MNKRMEEEDREKDIALRETISRIQTMEQHLDEILEAMQQTQEPAKLLPVIGRQLAILTQYYESGQWMEDYDTDARGQLPKDLKRGILAQDTFYNLLSELREDLENGDTNQ